MKTKLFFRSEMGQSLLEIAVSLGLITIIITVLTITTMNGLKNSQFAKNQVLASSYAQQGVELIKVMRQRDCPITLNGGTVYRWFDTSLGQPLVWPMPGTADGLAENNANTFTANSVTCQLTQTTNAENLENGLFSRRTKLERIAAGVLRVTVEVSWNDFSGSHKAENVSIVTNY